MPLNKRKHARVPLNSGSIPPAKMTLYKPFYREPFDVEVRDLSAGGMKILSPEVFPLYFDFGLELRLEGVQSVQAKGKAVHQIKTEKEYDIGIIFTEIDNSLQTMLVAMGQDHQACEDRIRRTEPNVCRKDCKFLPLCSKPQKSF